jgi:hypothetical protein
MTMDFTFDKQQQETIGALLDERISVPVSIEVWSRKDSAIIRPDRDPCAHCEDTVRLARLLSALHPALTVTLYDLDRHAARAAEAGIDTPPLTVLRGRNGRDVRVLGFWTGALFPATVDVITYLSSETTPLADESKEALSKVDRDIRIEVLGALYDAYSAHMLRLAGALAAESRLIKVQFTELVEFPGIALARDVDAVPVLLIEGVRFLGVWDETSLVKQVTLIAAGDDTIVSPETPLTVPYYSESDIERMAAANAQSAQAPPTTPGGLYLPGR